MANQKRTSETISETANRLMRRIERAKRDIEDNRDETNMLDARIAMAKSVLLDIKDYTSKRMAGERRNSADFRPSVFLSQSFDEGVTEEVFGAFNIVFEGYGAFRASRGDGRPQAELDKFEGATTQQMVREKIRVADAVILVWTPLRRQKSDSESSQSSKILKPKPSDWLVFEAGIALGLHKPIVAIVAEPLLKTFNRLSRRCIDADCVRSAPWDFQHGRFSVEMKSVFLWAREKLQREMDEASDRMEMARFMSEQN